MTINEIIESWNSNRLNQLISEVEQELKDKKLHQKEIYAIMKSVQYLAVKELERRNINQQK